MNTYRIEYSISFDNFGSITRTLIVNADTTQLAVDNAFATIDAKHSLHCKDDKELVSIDSINQIG